MMKSYNEIYLFLLLAVPLACTSQQINDDREEKLISTFQIVRFPNDACISSTATRNGTCYTSAECSDKGGSSSGSCADGFGVCCTFVFANCGSTTQENITYWTQPAAIATTASTCGLTVCPVSDDICQLRIDFLTFVITGPNTMTISASRRLYGQVIGALNDANIEGGSNYATNCQLDHFSIQGVSPSSAPPIVCGSLTGHHMYLEADTDRCNKMNFVFAAQIDAPGVAIKNTRGLATVAARTWDMTISQIECTSTVLPPPGCSQYFFGGAASYFITSYNYFATAGTSVHLANQHQRFCMRRERGMCHGCFSTVLETDFEVSGDPGATGATGVHYGFVGGCCGYATVAGGAYAQGDLLGTGAVGTSQFGWDCIIIPGAEGPTQTVVPTALQTAALLQQSLLTLNIAPTPWPPQICGGGGGIGPGTADLDTVADFSDLAGHIASLTVCTKHTPFTLEWLSNDMEGIGGTPLQAEFSDANQQHSKGFNLVFQQLGCTAT